MTRRRRTTKKRSNKFINKTIALHLIKHFHKVNMSSLLLVIKNRYPIQI